MSSLASQSTILQENHFHVLICHPKTKRILIRKDRRLPVVLWKGYFSRQPDVMCRLVQDHITANFDLIYLQVECEARLRGWFTPTLMIFEVRSSELPRAPEDHAWLTQAQADKVEIHPPTEAVILYMRDFKQVGLNVHVDRLFPYAKAGWFEKASTWVKECLRNVGHDVESVTQFRNGIEGCILLVEIESGSRFYMKGLPFRAFNDEIAVSCALGELMPWAFSKPVLINGDKNWMVMRDYGRVLSKNEYTTEEDLGLVRTVLLEWTKIQKKSIPMVEKLSAAGVPLLDGNSFKQRVEQTLNDPEYLEAQIEKMTEAEKEKYGKEGYKRELLAYVGRLCDRLSEYNVPMTLVHGDLNPANVTTDGKGSFTFFDFAYTRISFPFTDAITFMLTCGAEEETFLDFYLDLWTEYENTQRLRVLFRLAKRLRRVEHSIMSLHFYKKTSEGRRLVEREELGDPMCYLFEEHI